MSFTVPVIDQASDARAPMAENLDRQHYPEPRPEETNFGDGVPDDGLTVVIADDGESITTIDPHSGATKIETADGGVVIDLNPALKPKRTGTGKFDENLAEVIDTGELARIESELFQAIETDDQSRQEWLQQRAKGIEMLGFKVEEPRGDAGSSAAPVEGMSTVRHTLLPEAVIRFQSNSSAELLPAGGPVKVRNDAIQRPPAAPPEDDLPADFGQLLAGNHPDDDDDEDDTHPPLKPLPPGMDANDLAEALETDMNHYLTAIDKGYRADTDRMLFWVGFGGVGFKKVYNDPIRRMPLSRSCDAGDLIVSNAANDISDAGRITHVIKMRPSTMKRMQIAGVYLDRENMSEPNESFNAVEQRIAQVQGLTPVSRRPEDMEYTVYECYCELDIAGFEHKDKKGKITGLQLPYRVSIDKDSRQILEIRRNWKEEDPECLAKQVFVKYPFVPAFGFYEIGLLQILGNADKALTAAWRMMLDSGMFASFPGFLYGDSAGRQNTNEFRVPPGGGVKIQIGQKKIGDVVMPLPYKDVSVGLAQLTKMIGEDGQRIGGTAELPVGEGRQDAPVGTTLALIEQATKMLAAVHIRLHAAQAEEFQLLRERFKEDPKAFWRHNKRPAMKWQVETFLAALDNFDIVPMADPNTPSHMHRIMKAVAIKQLQAAAPELYDAKAVDSRIMRMIGVDPTGLFAPPTPPGEAPPDPKMAAVMQKAELAKQQAAQKEKDQMLDAAAREDEQAARMAELKTESADRAADRASRERVALTRDHIERLKAAMDMVMQGLADPAVLQQIMNENPAAAAPPATPGPQATPPATPGPYPRVI